MPSTSSSGACRSSIRRSAWLLFEIGYDQGEAVSALMKEHFAEVRVIQDLAGLDRVVSGVYCG